MRARVYWASPFFDRAWATYNQRCRETLRSAGFDVFLPQEHAMNSAKSDPDAKAIFEIDSSAIRGCQLMVAVIDGETIDSGVAAEAGLAFAWRIPIVGLYTDLRQHRRGEGRSYKNLFVLGLLRSTGGIVDHEDDLPPTLLSALQTPPGAVGA